MTDDWLDEESEDDAEEPRAAAHIALTFSTGGTLFGLRIARVAEIVALPQCTPLPESPPWLLGMATLRGRMVPLIDLRRRLGLGASGGAARPCVVVTEGGEFPIGLIMDRVCDVVSIPPECLAPPPVRGGSGFVSAIGRVGEQVAILLDPERLLDPAEQRALSETLLAAMESEEDQEPPGKPPRPPGGRPERRPAAAPAPRAQEPRPTPPTAERDGSPGRGPHAR
jgi:purine-binding chemotaxis protein CheW